MASSALLTLDLTAPDAAVEIEEGVSVTSSVDVDIAITSAASDKAQMKIYGDVDDAFATSEYRASEANAPWISFAGTKSIRLSATDGVKTVRVKVRDDVNNTSSEATDTITLSTEIPVITITTALAPTKISKQTGKDTATLEFESDVELSEWQVRIVPSANSTVSAGTQIEDANGSVVSGEDLDAETSQEVTIVGADLEAAGASGAGATGTQHRIKVFGRSADNGLWSVGSD